MPRRLMLRAWAMLGLPLALFSAAPSVQWCSGPWPPMTEEQFVACLVSEFTGCTAEVDCALPACGSSDASASCPPPLACEGDCPEQEARGFCLGNPAGGFGLKPAPDDAPRPDPGVPAALARGLDPPVAVGADWLAAPETGPPPEPRRRTAPIRGPPSA